ncbi:MAG: CocE/NonD family hydrolase [Candidatus Hydrogenedentes bacterium]|nr:CocE/NonD family hydrolase [Candidatus Hydrogenedentota bacterium]
MSRANARVILLLALICQVGWLAEAESKKTTSLDTNWAPYSTKPALQVKSVSTAHFYLTMRDGVKIAVTQYLPKQQKPGEKLSAILQSTRYMRAYDLRWPFESKEAPSESIRTFLANGYAYISVDARGSGASFGRWPCPWAPDEVKDYGEVCTWIVQQPWSDGAIGCRGISYDGTTAEMTVTTLHPAIKAVAPEFSLFDSYTDVGFPGGIHLSEFTKIWSEGNAAIDKDEVRKKLHGMERLVLVGVKPVDDDKNKLTLKAAIASHVWNGDVFTACSGMTFKDDAWMYEPSLHFADISPSGKIDELRKAGIPIYNYSGWFDGGYQYAAIKRFLTVKNQGSKLVIGPWSHAGRFNSGPLVQDVTAFDHTAELLRFFDRYVKGKQSGIDSEPAIHYYTLIEEKWKTSDAWPPAAERTIFYLGEGNRLSAREPEAASAADTYTPDYTAGTGKSARWNTLMGGVKVTYPDRATEDQKLLTYTTPPLAADTEVTGHPLVTLFIQSAAVDGQFFVYLEDIDEKGVVHYVTEGELRALCRKVSNETQPYVNVGPYHSFLRKDAELLKPGETTELDFDLLPTSYLFKKGHSIRIAIAGADKDHFHPTLFPPAEVRFLRDIGHASHIVLPFVAH